MPDNRTLQAFLRKHMGHAWHQVSVDEHEYGDLGEKVQIRLADDKHSTTHFQSTVVTEDVAVDIADKLTAFGFTNPADFTKIDTGAVVDTGLSVEHGSTPNRSNHGFLILFTKEGAERATINEKFVLGTKHIPIITDTGIARQVG